MAFGLTAARGILFSRCGDEKVFGDFAAMTKGDIRSDGWRGIRILGRGDA